MKRTFRDYVEDILTSFEETQEFTQGLDLDAFARDRRMVSHERVEPLLVGTGA